MPISDLFGAARRLRRGSATHVTGAPDPQHALDIFAGEWASRLPPPFERLTAGAVPLFEDARLTWALERLGGASGKRVLELGPLEGAHTYMLDRAGAADVLAIEGNPRAYLKCLVVKELLGIRSARFELGDFTVALERCAERFDLVIASGVLYHLVDPVALIAHLGRVTDAVYMWTHYYDAARFAANPKERQRVVAPREVEHAGYRHRLYRHEYAAARAARGFCGGTRRYANWLDRETLLDALRHFGFTGAIEVAHEVPDHPNGPALALIARR